MCNTVSSRTILSVRGNTMKFISSALVATIIAISAMPALAQETPTELNWEKGFVNMRQPCCMNNNTASSVLASLRHKLPTMRQDCYNFLAANPISYRQARDTIRLSSLTRIRNLGILAAISPGNYMSYAAMGGIVQAIPTQLQAQAVAKCNRVLDPGLTAE